jgi:hypothetical protein
LSSGFFQCDVVVAVPVESDETSFRPGAPKPLFQTRLDLNQAVRQYEVTPDGQRFLVEELSTTTTRAGVTPLTAVTNWQAGLQ